MAQQQGNRIPLTFWIRVVKVDVRRDDVVFQCQNSFYETIQAGCSFSMSEIGFNL